MPSTPPLQPSPKENGIVQRTRLRCRSLDAVPGHVLIGCSAGKDSVALTACLAELARSGTFQVTVAHINHSQHDMADTAAEAVRQIGRQLDLDVRTVTLNDLAIRAHRGVGLEEALRRERYLALAAIATDVGADTLALAHHQQDQAETVLMHLIRGAGIDGLTGMREWELRAIPWWDGTSAHTEIALWRPFLEESLSTIVDCAERSGLPVVEDPTNLDTSWRRNAIRHEVVPVLERLAPGSIGAIARSARILQTDAAVIQSLVAQALASCTEEQDLLQSRLVSLQPELQGKVVLAWLRENGIMSDVSADRVGAIVNLARTNRGGAKIQVGGMISVHLLAGRLRLEAGR